MEDIKDQAPENSVVCLIGNKTDLPDWIITKEQATELTERNKIEYYETSAKTGHGINEIFHTIAKHILDS